MAYLKNKDKPFTLGHFILYAKGWYQSTENIFDDLKIVLSMDDYTPFTKTDCMQIIVNQYSKYFEVNLTEFLSSIQESEIWKHGYYTTNNNPKSTIVYDYQTAIIYKIMSELRFTDVEQYKRVIPKYNKGLKRPKSISLQRLLSIFNLNEKYLSWKTKNLEKVFEY